ncbi:hypothetical protein K490DRAFT_42001 [Saccharata proteae CBS 121410]|uniref:Uncharacterized protein n=1 Tax=Saccharata proteae CBS 121410 TaxID=1314787 RepID=A0A9P4HVY5_9PEZI|nr:hypothetical protein K490DRAFT_42001 [Saccharata proteae CBS 121410]
MSLDAGGLAQMTYNNFSSNGLGVPSAGFASRGKGSHLKRLSAAAQPRVGSISENNVDVPTPRTSRSHLLAGLRTQPKTPGPVPQSAPYGQQQHQFGVGGPQYGGQKNNGMGYGVPQTAIGSGFPMSTGNQYGLNSQHMYPLPEQVLAPPPMQYEGQEDGEMDPNVLAQLVATEMYLQQRQQQLQQQLLNLTTQSMSGMNIGNNGNYRQQQQYPITPMTPQFYNQQAQGLQQGIQQLQELPPGVSVVYNPMLGQYQYVLDQNMAQTQLSNSPPPPTPSFTHSPPKSGTPTFRAQVSPPPETKQNPFDLRDPSPHKKTPSPAADVMPLPPPSANAFRRGHKKNLSSFSLNLNDANGVPDGPKSAFVRPVGFPATPQTGTFGPGQGRAGEHPTRQPRGPPPLEELQALPTTKHEGSKNFATRQRRRAVHNLVRAGIERRGVRSGSGGSMTPVSEAEMNFSISSDNETDSVRSGSLSGKPSIGSLRAAASGAIGSERKANSRSRDRNGSDGFSANSMASDDGVEIGGRLVEVRVDEPRPAQGQRRKTPLLVLTSAEKRKSSMY